MRQRQYQTQLKQVNCLTRSLSVCEVEGRRGNTVSSTILFQQTWSWDMVGRIALCGLHEALAGSPASSWVWQRRPWSQQGAEAGGSEVQSHSQLHNELCIDWATYQNKQTNKQTNKETGETNRWAVKSTGCSCRASGFDFQHPHDAP